MLNNIETNRDIELYNNEGINENVNFGDLNTEKNIDINVDKRKSLIQDFVKMIKLKLQSSQNEGINDNINKNENISRNENINQNESTNQNQQELTQEKNYTIQEQKVLVIDRFEENFAVCENRETLEIENIEIEKLPQNVKEGDIIKFSNNVYEIDTESKEIIENRINEKLNNLFTD